MRSECPACKHPFAWHEPKTRVKRQANFFRLDPIVPYCPHCKADLRYIRPHIVEWGFRIMVVIWALWFLVDVLNLTSVKSALGSWPHLIVAVLLPLILFAKGRYESA